MHIDDAKKYKRYSIIKFTYNQFNCVFGNKIQLKDCYFTDKAMGYYKLEYLYIPKNYKFIFEHDRGYFTIKLLDSEEAFTYISYIYPELKSDLSEPNIRLFIEKLKYHLDKDDLEFYVLKNNQRVKKVGH